MFKTLTNKDELEEQHKFGTGSMSKIDKMTKKEVMEKEKPLDPKFIFDGKIKDKNKKSKYRKPKGDDIVKKPLITLNDFNDDQIKFLG